MRKPLLALLPITLVVVLGIVLLPGAPARKSAAGPGCNNPVDSALNQYCDPVPSSTGAQAPRAGQRALAAVLPARVVRRINHDRRLSGGDRRSLLRLPAPGARRPLRRGIESAGVGSLSEWMIVVLVVLAIVLAGAAVALSALGRRRAEPRSHDE